MELRSKGFVTDSTHLGCSELLVPGNFRIKGEMRWLKCGSDEGGKALKKQRGLDTETGALVFHEPRAGPRAR